MGFVLTYMLYTYSPHTDISHVGGHLTYGLLFYLCVCVCGGGGGRAQQGGTVFALPNNLKMDTSLRHITLS